MADQFSTSDVELLGQKMEQLSQTLTPGEQAALVEILERAISSADDVQGYLRATPKLRSTSSVKLLVKSALRVS